MDLFCYKTPKEFTRGPDLENSILFGAFVGVWGQEVCIGPTMLHRCNKTIDLRIHHLISEFCLNIRTPMKNMISNSSPIFDQSIDRHRTISPDLVGCKWGVPYIVKMVTEQQKEGGGVEGLAGQKSRGEHI